MPISKSSKKNTKLEVTVDTPIPKKKRTSQRPAKLAGKLKRIRLNHRLSQSSMLNFIHPEDTGNGRARICQLETGMRLPTLMEIWSYAKFARVSIETLIDDDKDLPNRFL